MDKPTILNPSAKPLQVFLSASLQLGQLLAQLLAFTGPAKIVISTFSSGEEFLVKLLSLKNKGLVTNAVCYLDIKAAEKTARNNVMMKNVYDELHLCRNHSKAILIYGKEMTVAVLTSQNTTRGNRLESYAIILSDSLADSLLTTLRNYNASRQW